MDVHELSSLLEMQKQTQLLLETLQIKQQTFRQTSNTSLNGTGGQLQPSSSNKPSAQSKRDVEAKVRHIRDALAAGTKLNSYRKVTPGGPDKPGRRPGFKLAQGIDNTPTNQPTLRYDSTEHKENLFTEDLEEMERSQNTSVSFQEDVTATSPKRPTTSFPLTETPKSILKRRKIIDDNVKVSSKYPHTPVVTPKKGSRGLNYSYSEDVDDLRVPSSMASSDNPRYSEVTDGSYIEECTQNEPQKQTNVDSAAIDELMKERLMLDSGNDRQNASLVRGLSQRPRSVLFEKSEEVREEGRGETLDNQDGAGSHSQSSSVLALKSRPPLASATRDRPLLGYDWIAGVLDNHSDGTVLPAAGQLPDDYLREISDFRRRNKEQCESSGVFSKLDLTRPISPELQDPGHKCLHGFTVNDRLYTEPMNPDEEGRSRCPVCLISRDQPTIADPGFVRVSIPRSTLETPYRVKPRRRRSFDDTDSCALSQHCQAGYECAIPTAIPTAKNIDLKGANGIQGKQAMSLNEAENFIKTHSRTARTLATDPGSALPSRERSSTAESLLNASRGQQQCEPLPRRQHKSTTAALLNLSHGLRYDLQELARRSGRDDVHSRAANSTGYPLL